MNCSNVKTPIINKGNRSIPLFGNDGVDTQNQKRFCMLFKKCLKGEFKLFSCGLLIFI